MSDGRSTRKLLWWHMPIDDDENAPAGRYMALVVLIWFGVLLVVGVVVGHLFAG